MATVPLQSGLEAKVWKILGLKQGVAFIFVRFPSGLEMAAWQTEGPQTCPH